ncbi:MAG: hypothetical protein A2329_08550 [Sulfurimonas sp. RIFOXYB2_FULL_37_5]|uniref:DUF6781 family protein n=1 Tax=Sulfurimonas sp. RIFOXYB12_FULL_35_9 TaxID=1802256 RepID=UPI0008C3B764|nr:DUF6781 family protein [Sulfurimonas sp. RIFOXYB12_FULL_35_9]OHE03891.1 MAG: hypothetical protein A2345_03255 [Sulfurimonas sp. RIFOXYB12_FULL_35_9]OHE07263.1 MAG: hypothetical protein A2329_08550 [Sulfurimonas sp. RIFOXYB2_FULL_37_5]
MELQELQKIDFGNLSLHEIKDITSEVIGKRTKNLRDELEDLLLQKELLEKNIEKKSSELQEAKYTIFNEIESIIDKNDALTLSKLHQAKLQSIDLFDLLGETVESAIITTLEKSKDSEAKNTIEEIIKELTFETIKEGTLNTIRVRKILSTILHSSIDIAEASSNFSEEILEATLKGMRGGLMQSIDRFKKRLAYMPLEAKHILIEDYDTIMQDLNHTDVLFSQVVQNIANESTNGTRKTLLEINQRMHYDLEELVHMSKETALVMREKFSAFAKTAVKKADTALHSQSAKEAKRMGIQAWGVAKTALNNAIKSAKNKIDSKE